MMSGWRRARCVGALAFVAITTTAIECERVTDRGHEIDEGAFEVDRVFVHMLSDSWGELGGARGAPQERNGRIEGVRVFALRGASALGLENGDVIRVVNRRPIRSTTALLAIFARIDELDTVELAVTRRGMPVRLTWRLISDRRQ